MLLGPGRRPAWPRSSGVSTGGGRSAPSLADAARSGLDAGVGRRRPRRAARRRAAGRPRRRRPAGGRRGPGRRGPHRDGAARGARHGPGAWRARRHAVVVVEGATRVGTPLAAMLAASGVGRVSVRDAGLTGAGDAVVGGLSAADEGRPRALAAADAVRRANPLTDLRPLPPGATRRSRRPRPAVGRVGPARRRRPARRRAAPGGDRAGGDRRRRAARRARRHELPAVRRPAPPGRRSAVARGSPPSSPPPIPRPAGPPSPACSPRPPRPCRCSPSWTGTPPRRALDATLELRPPDLLPRVRRWPPHPACDCGAAAGVPRLPVRPPARATR